MTDVVIIGAGAAGTAAAVTLAERGARVTIVIGPAGATQLGPGALDGKVDEARWVVDALGAFVLEDCLLPTHAGILRAARGRDRSLLDVSRIGHAGDILLPRAPRHGWDADALARMFAGSSQATEHGLTFRAIDATLLRMTDERLLPDATLAARHDDGARLAWLAERLRIALQNAGAEARRPRAILLPPWLGRERERATELSELVGVPCGEIAVGLAGPAGFRFAAARDRALDARRITRLHGFAISVRETESRVAIALESGDTLHADACVLATGGLVGGGLMYTPSEAVEAAELPTDPQPYVHASLADAPIGLGGRLLDVPGSLFGVAPETLAWPFVEHGDLERVGVLVAEGGLVHGRARLYACGELTSDLPRTWLEAIRAGHAVGRAIRLSADAEGRARSSG